MANNKLYIPTFISDERFNPARVQPRLFYYNGKIEAPEYKVDAWVSDSGLSRFTYTKDEIPYFDHYNVVTGSLPSSNSNSLLFFNEEAVYGVQPSNTLFSEYWETYIELLYNPVTRLINAEAVIPLAEYFELELNDIIEWRGNYYHLRAVNDYSFTTGECSIQLLGPIIEDALDPTLGNCIEYSIINLTLFDEPYDYIDCDGNAQSGTAFAESSANVGCAQSGSVSLRGGAFSEDVSLSEGAICGTYIINP